MKKSVFISHASKDKRIAFELCERLEKAGVGCWIAPRDIPPGESYGEAIITGMKSCSVCILVLSQNANLSQMVANEIERAASFEKTIIPLRIRNVQPAEKLQLFVASKQWVDAFAAPIADRIEYIAAVVQAAESKMPPPLPGPERAGFAARAELWLEKVFRHKMLSAVAAVVLLGGIGVSGLAMQQRTQATVKEAAVEMRQAANATVEAVTPTLRVEQSDEAMIGALRLGDVTTVRRLLTQGAKASPVMAAGLVGELADKPDDLRRMLSAFRVATADQAETAIKETAALLDQDMDTVQKLGDRASGVEDADTIEKICSGMGGTGPLSRAIRRFIANRISCLNAFRDQSIIAPLWQTMDALTGASHELGLAKYSNLDWVFTITRVYTDVTRSKNTDPNREFRTFVDFSSWDDMQNKMFGATPIPAQQQEKPRFLQSVADSVQYIAAGMIVIAEAKFYHEKSMTGDSYLQVAAGKLDTGVTIGLHQLGVNLKLGTHPAAKPLTPDRVSFRKEFSPCWNNDRLKSSHEIIDEGVSARMNPSYKGDYNENVKQSQRNIIASRRYCDMRVALLPQQPRMSVWLEIITYQPLSVPSAPAPTTRTTPIAAPDAAAPQQPVALPLGTSPESSALSVNTQEQGAAKPLPGQTTTLVEPPAPAIASAPLTAAQPTPIESLIGQPPASAPQGLIEALAPGAQRKLIANLNTRARPSTNSALVYEIQPNTAIVITGLVENGDWAAVSVQGKPVGFVRATALERNSGAPTLGAANPVGVAEALANPQGWPAVIPGPVATVLNERRKKCREANQAMNSGQLLQADIDGDGAADFIVDDSNGCSAVQSLFCGATGSCSAQLFFSSREFRDSGTLLHRGLTIRPGRGNTMDIVASLNGSECNRANYEPCEKRFRWTGRTLAEVQAR